MKKPYVIILVVVVIAVGGVTWLMLSKKDTKSNTTNTATTDQPTKEPPPVNAAVATDKVTIKDFSFSPATITVKKGTTVTWTNQDSTSHTVTSTTGTTLNSNTLKPGDTYQVTFNEVGTFDYHCKIHSSMTGSVLVTE